MHPQYLRTINMYRVIHRYSDNGQQTKRFVYRVGAIGFGMNQVLKVNNLIKLLSDAQSLLDDLKSHGWANEDYNYIEVQVSDTEWVPHDALRDVEQMVKL